MDVDLNADLGESPQRWESGDDVALLDVITSANVCCGAYAGDERLMRLTCEASIERGVVIGAQVGYPDREHFGRAPYTISRAALRDEIRRQIELLDGIAHDAGGSVAYVKPHGALYNAVVHDERQASALVEALDELDLPLLGLPGSVSLALAADVGLPTVHEGFADRAYRPDGTLVPRDEPGAVLTDHGDVAVQAVRLLHDGVASICVHSDTPGALELARIVRAALEHAGAILRSSAG